MKYSRYKQGMSNDIVPDKAFEGMSRLKILLFTTDLGGKVKSN